LPLDQAATRYSFSSPRTTILSASSGNGSLQCFASSHGALIQTSRSLELESVAASGPCLLAVHSLLDGPSHDYLTPPHLQFIDWPIAQTRRKALIEATDTDLVE